jgi:hypothetical protein
MGELVGAEGRAIVEVDLSGKPSFAQGLHEAVGEVFEVLLKIEFSMGNQTGVVIQESEEKALSDLPLHDDRGAVHAVGLPEVIGKLGFIASEILLGPLRLVEAPPLKQPVEALNRGMKVGKQKFSFPG